MTVKQFPMHLVRRAEEHPQPGAGEGGGAPRMAEVIDISHRFAGGVVGGGPADVAAPSAIPGAAAPAHSAAPTASAHGVANSCEQPGGREEHARRLRRARELASEAESRVEFVAAEPQEQDIAEDARKLLARRALSSGELLHRLLEQGHPREIAEQQVEDCINRLYLDDAALAERLCEKLRGEKGMSRTQIYLKLRERMLPQQVIDTALATLEAEEEDKLMLQAAHKRAGQLRGLPFDVAERRLLGYLARRGWGGSAAREAARQALSEEQGDAHSVYFQ